jgi:hypothetical protein
VPGNCLIVPIHVPGAKWLELLLDSIPGNPVDFTIVLAVSNSEEAAHFAILIENLRAARPWSIEVRLFDVRSYIADTLNFQNLLARYDANESRCIINVKKFTALHWAAREGFGFAACIDADCIAVSDLTGLFGLLKSNYAQGKYLGAFTQDEFLRGIMLVSASPFSMPERHRARELTSEGSFYPWFFDIPAYDLADMRLFFEHMAPIRGDLEGFFTALSWHTFEHVVFMYWRVLSGRAEFVRYDDAGVLGEPENLMLDDLDTIEARHRYRPAWARFGIGLEYPPGTCLAYHFDREPEAKADQSDTHAVPLQKTGATTTPPPISAPR